MIPITNKKKIVILVSCCLTLVVCAGLYLVYLQISRNQMIDITLKWANVAPFPDNIQEFTINSVGSMFTRSFRSQFKASKDVIDDWLSKSPGLQGVKPLITDNSIRNYKYRASNGANYVEVIINDITNTVMIYVSWS